MAWRVIPIQSHRRSGRCVVLPCFRLYSGQAVDNQRAANRHLIHPSDAVYGFMVSTANPLRAVPVSTAGEIDHPTPGRLISSDRQVTGRLQNMGKRRSRRRAEVTTGAEGISAARDEGLARRPSGTVRRGLGTRPAHRQVASKPRLRRAHCRFPSSHSGPQMDSDYYRIR